VKYKIGLVGAGIGNLTLALLLSKNNMFDITIFEKSEKVGGRLSPIEFSDGSKIDKGPTIVLLEKEIREILGHANYKLDQEKVKSLDLLYNVQIDGKNFNKYKSMKRSLDEYDLELKDKEAMQKYIEKWTLFYNKNFTKLTSKRYKSFWDMFTMIDLAKALPYKKYQTEPKIKDNLIKSSYQIQSLYQGTNPATTNNVLHLIAAHEHIFGIGQYKNGYFNLALEIREELAKRNVKILFKQNIKSIDDSGNLITEKENYKFDKIVSNIDYPNNGQIIKDFKSKKYESSSSVINYYILTKNKVDLPVNSFYLSKNYIKDIGKVLEKEQTVETSSFYVHNPKNHPEKKGMLYVMIPTNQEQEVSINDNDINNFLIRKQYIKDASEIIEIKRVDSKCWAKTYNLFENGLFGIAFKTNQIGPFRPQNKMKYKNIYFVGASVHPGGGVPIVMQSSYNCYQQIMEDLNEKL
jgi:phytoene desaturase